MEDEAYASHLVGLAMLGLYASQGVDDAESEAAATDSSRPLPRASTTTARTPSSRSREEFNVTNPILIQRHHAMSRTASSTPSSSSHSPAGSGSVPSPVLSPLAQSPSDSRTRSTFSPSVAAVTSSGSSPSSDSSDSDDSGGGRRRLVSYDPSIHLRAKKRLSRAIDARSLSEKLRAQAAASSSSSEQRLHHERFASLVLTDGSLTLSQEELPTLAAWGHLGSFLLHSPRVISLAFRSVPITEASLEALGRSVLSSIRSLVFSDNRIGLQAGVLPLIVSLLSSCLALQSLAITRNSLTDVDVIWRLLESHRQLRSISLQDNGLDTAAALALANAIRRIAHNHQHHPSPHPLAESSDSTDDGVCVDLSYNRIDAQGEAALRAAREELSRLTQGRMDVELLLRRLPRSPFFPPSPSPGAPPPLTLPSPAGTPLSWSWLANRSSRMVTQLMLQRGRSGGAGVTLPPVAFSLSRYATLPSLATTPRQ